MFKLNTKFDANSLLCSLNGIYYPHWLVQWSCPCSHMSIPVTSPRLPGYIDSIQTVLVILTMAGVFPDRPHTTHFVYSFILGWRLKLFYPSAVVNNAAMNMGLQYLFKSLLSILWILFSKQLKQCNMGEVLQEPVTVGSYSNSVFNFLRNHRIVFLEWLHHFTFPSAVRKSPSFCTSSPIVVIF